MHYVSVSCPWCFEASEIAIEPDLEGEMIVDCEVCCRPWVLRVRWEGEQPTVDVERGN